MIFTSLVSLHSTSIDECLWVKRWEYLACAAGRTWNGIKVQKLQIHRSGFKSYLHHFLAMYPWASNRISQSLVFFSYKMDSWFPQLWNNSLSTKLVLRVEICISREKGPRLRASSRELWLLFLILDDLSLPHISPACCLVQSQLCSGQSPIWDCF